MKSLFKITGLVAVLSMFSTPIDAQQLSTPERSAALQPNVTASHAVLRQYDSIETMRPENPALGGIPGTVPRRQTQSAGGKDYKMEDLSLRAQKTARLVAGRENYGKITDIDLEQTIDGTVWEIEFESIECYAEIHIDQNGIFVTGPGLIDFRITRPVPGSFQADRAGASGREVRKSSSSVAPKWEDLTPAIKKIAAKFGGPNNVADIDRELKDTRTEYEIEFRREGFMLEIQFSEDGRITESNDLQAAPIDAAPESGEEAAPLGLRSHLEQSRRSEWQELVSSGIA